MAPTESIQVVIDNLLEQQQVTEQVATLAAAGLLNARGLDMLLDEAEELADVELAKARQLCLLCEEVAQMAAAPEAAPRAQYLRARTHAIHGEFDLALALIQKAATQYTSLGMRVEALRTQVGLMNVLDELGRYPEALAIGQRALDEIAQLSQGTAPENAEALSESTEGATLPELQRIAARIHINRGVSNMQLGRYQDALDAYALAEEHFAALDDHEWLANVLSNQSLILTYMGRVRDALAAFERAVALRADMPPSLSHAHTFLNMGEAHSLLGNYGQSLAAFRQAHELMVAIDARVDQQINQLHIAEVYLTLNLYPEAVAAYAGAETALDELNMIYERALALWGMGAARTRQGRFGEAEVALVEAATLFRQIENAPLSCGVLLEQAALLALQGQEARALTLAQDALELVSGDGVSGERVSGEAGSWPVQQLYAHLRLADLLLPNTQAAEEHLLAAEQLLATVTLPHLRYRWLQRLGRLRLLQQREAEAQRYLESAIAEIEQFRKTLTHEVMRTSFLVDKLAAYEALTQLYLARGNEQSVRLAFEVAERARARALVDLLAGVFENTPTDGDDPLLSTQLPSLQAELNALYTKLLDDGERRENPLSIQHLRARAGELEQQIALLRLQATTHATYTYLPSVQAALQESGGLADPLAASFSAAEIQAQLPQGVVMVSYYVLDDEIMAFVINRQRLVLVRALSTTATIQQLLQRLDLQWERFRAGRAFVERHLTLLEQSTQRLLAALYDVLFAPLMPHLEGAYASAGILGEGIMGEGSVRQLAVVPHGLLHQLPFQALYDGEGYLLDRYVISYAPSATAWTLCQQRSAPPSTRALVMGVADESLPAVEIEVNAVTQVLEGAAYAVDLRLNEDATVAALPTGQAHCSLLHVASHGLFRADNPMFSALKLHDGWFTASDAMQLKLAGAMVTLSACESGRSRVMVGDEILGLIRAFLGAGAATLVVSQWLVQDEAAAFLMTRWYEQMHLEQGHLHEAQNRAAALRTAQLMTKARYAHPYYWAPFILIGQLESQVYAAIANE